MSLRKPLKKAVRRAIHHVSDRQTRAKAAAEAGTTRNRKRRRPRLTPIERRMAVVLRSLDVPYRSQYAIPREGRYLGRFYYVDFALPRSRIAIECDGKKWHTGRLQEARDRRRQHEIERMGWLVVRFTGSEIWTNPDRCEQVLRSLLLKGTP